MLALLFLLATVGATALAAVALIVTKLRESTSPRLTAGIALAFAAWCALYGSALVGTSLASEPHVLAPDQNKRFCGFYLDCHLHAAVVDFDTAHALGAGAARVEATGVFVKVTLRVSSDARRSPIHFVGPRAVVRDARGREFAAIPAAEQALASVGAPSFPLTGTISAGEEFRTTLVFDVPKDAGDLVLDLTDGYTVDRVIELFLIGDDDSLLHPRTVFRLSREGV